MLTKESTAVVKKSMELCLWGPHLKFLSIFVVAGRIRARRLGGVGWVGAMCAALKLQFYTWPRGYHLHSFI